MSSNSLETQLMRLGEKQESDQLQKLIKRTSINELKSALNAKLGRNDCINFWNYLLQAFDLSDFESLEKRFACVKCFLDGLLKVELTYKQTYDLITRLCQDLSTFASAELIEVLEHCVDGMRAGDPKCVSWKDLLPEALNVLVTQSELNVNGVTMSGVEYRDGIIKNLCTMRWPTAVLTPIADMFKYRQNCVPDDNLANVYHLCFRELRLSNAEVQTVLNKFAGVLPKLSPMELPALMYQLFSMCSNASHIIIPLIALDKYFHRFYYKKLFSDMCSNSTDLDSIDAFSDKELREAEETILHHLNYCTQYKISETQLLLVFRNFLNMPDVILTPFILSAILSMTAANRDPETARLSTAILLPFLRSVIRHNEDERMLADYSVWCRDTLQRKQVDLDQIFTVLIDQNKEGKDVITPGLVNLVFMLLKAKQCKTLNTLAMQFLTKFIRKRFVFGQGIVKRIASWMIVEQEQYQYSECLTLLSVADTFTVSECVKTINYVMDFFLWLPGEQAMRMMSFILPTLKLSNIVRDAFIEVLRKAMNSCDVSTRRMAVYGFCMILKQLNNSNSQRAHMNASGYCTQQNISGFSLMTQSSFGNRTNPHRNFDMLTLEIVGLLRTCFTQSLEIRCTLYENLQRAVELNPKLVSHVLQFIDWHFRACFEQPALDADVDDVDDITPAFCIKYESLVYATDAQKMELELKDNLGCLIQFVAHCLEIFERIEADYDVREMKRLIETCIEKVVTREIKFEDTSGPVTHLKCALLHQQLNIIEGLITYVLLYSKQTNSVIKNILPLFKQHSKLQEVLKALASTARKSQKRGKQTTDNETICGNLTINGVTVKKINTEAENIWNLSVIEKLLRVLHEDIVTFAAPEHTTAMRAHVELVRYVLEVAAHKVEAIRLEPEYKQLAHSKRTLQHLTGITKVVYERCIKRLPELWREFDMTTAALAAHCFMQCLKTANETYKKQFKEVFVKGFDFYAFNQCKEATYIVQDIIDEYMQEDASAKDKAEALSKEATASQIPLYLLQSLEVLYDNISFENRATTESYTWLLHFCQTYEVPNNELGLVHKLLFTQRQKTHSGAFFDTIALLLGKVLGRVLDDDAEPSQQTSECDFHLTSITLGSRDSCLQHLFAAVHKQIEDVEYFIIKGNNLNYKCRIVAEEDRAFQRASLDALDRAICTQLIHISRTLLELTNVCIPLGSTMDSLMRLLMQHYTCLKNLAKHFLSCSASTNVSIRSTKFDLLLHLVGKPLPTNIYALIDYIEKNVLEEKQRKKIDPQAEKAKVLRETKLIPKIILGIENFNKHVILLAKKTKDRLASYLHFGTVRDFRIKTSALQEAIERTYSHSSQIKVVESDVWNNDAEDSEHSDTSERENEDVAVACIEAESEAMAGNAESPPPTEADENEEAPKTHTNARKPTQAKRASGRLKANSLSTRATDRIIETDADEATSASSTPTPETVLANADMPTSTTQLLKNINKINKKSKKRALRESEQLGDPDVLCAVAEVPAPKRRRGRSVKK